ncbi:16S rRNA (guanine(527)-N(7))-methyltransferase RsmG [Marinimicrobium sp.]|jgi:16S rRNA (guanine527-N7)-methyltransferase|uniref:16S rRNA (guanine(527)-N(7))-methyltransferase RsmG n=3 Tax=unclassified Marinimicrobium TaxID=2632100 RepID=UPI000C5E6368|nr:16S rRNA (guanine(527)-N(7))-methyltransferase RsmG [Marinimicrobium sp.]MAN52614.1 16S rRNA (guanine(527)-N(7))-methyltransferase RsmG [Marinimicrobium sp.]|tara:strand:- start:107 stop:745 length:639 start_codon:yes stop_codon:yes gene_type:complete
MSEPLKARLTAGIAELGLTITEHQTEQLLTYLQEFHKWNRAYNLSAVRDIDAMLDRHLLDSLSVLAHVQARTPRRLIDVGTGGGLPGIPLAIALPDCQITLLDSNGKKTRFLFHIKTLLKLNNVTVENRRVEQFRPDQPFDIVISRAFASLSDMVSGCEHLLSSGGLFMAMKGVYPEAELAEVEGRVELVQSHPLQVPGNEGERHLLEMRLS